MAVGFRLVADVVFVFLLSVLSFSVLEDVALGATEVCSGLLEDVSCPASTGDEDGRSSAVAVGSLPSTGAPGSAIGSEIDGNGESEDTVSAGDSEGGAMVPASVGAGASVGADSETTGSRVGAKSEGAGSLLGEGSDGARSWVGTGSGITGS